MSAPFFAVDDAEAIAARLDKINHERRILRRRLQALKHRPLASRSWERLPYPVTVITSGAGEEVFYAVRPLFRRLFELTQGQAEVKCVKFGKRVLEQSSAEALFWYVENIDTRHIPVDGTARTPVAIWAALVSLLQPEFVR